ncbi:MAG: hypothetical protein KBE09_03765 [Candidatus Pacebacteria bacterium]|nr:hypothetical protein [Candidatus Paceibacterota bacterium]
MYIQSDHPQAPVRALLLGASIILCVEDVACGEALKRAAEVEESSQETADTATALLGTIASKMFPPCDSLATEQLRGPHARSIIRHALDNQGVTFCKPIDRE